MVFNVNVIFRLQTRRIRNQDATSIRLMDGLILKFEVYRNTCTAALGNVRCVMCDGCCQSLVLVLYNGIVLSLSSPACTLEYLYCTTRIQYNCTPVHCTRGMYMHSALVMIVTEVTVPEFFDTVCARTWDSVIKYMHVRRE